MQSNSPKIPEPCWLGQQALLATKVATEVKGLRADLTGQTPHQFGSGMYQLVEVFVFQGLKSESYHWPSHRDCYNHFLLPRIIDSYHVFILMPNWNHFFPCIHSPNHQQFCCLFFELLVRHVQVSKSACDSEREGQATHVIPLYRFPIFLLPFETEANILFAFNHLRALSRCFHWTVCCDCIRVCNQFQLFLSIHVATNLISSTSTLLKLPALLSAEGALHIPQLAPHY